MNAGDELPGTLQDAIVYFGRGDNAFDFFRAMRWPKGEAVCPCCGGKENAFLESRKIWKCRPCRKQFSVKVGTVFEDSPISLNKWLCAVWMIVNAKNGISSYEIHRSLGVTQKTAWFMMHRIRLALQAGHFDKMGGVVEADETFIGGKARNMHAHVRAQRITGNIGRDKTPVQGLLERSTRDKVSRVKLRVVPNVRAESVKMEVRKNVASGSEVHTDALRSYNGLQGQFEHRVIDHAVKYVDGNVHTNGLENFWSLLKRTLKGTYVSCEPFHLFRYLDEQSFRFNERKDTDGGRFFKAILGVTGKRLTYRRLIGEHLRGPKVANSPA